MDFDAPPAAVALDSMKREVETIMKSTGLVMDWRSLKDNRGGEAFSGLVVLRFRGRCQAQPWDGAGEQPAGVVTLGATQVSDGRILPFTEVECEQVRKTIPYSEQAGCGLTRQWALGRALGRVVAHELYHVLAGTTAHAAGGLAKATHNFRDLASGDVGFGRGEAAAIGGGVAAGRVTFSLR
jgi:hypothetical protein